VTVDEAEPYEADEGARPRDRLRDDVLGKLAGISQSAARIATALGRAKSDGTIRRVLHDLQADGLAEKRADGWGLPTLPTPRGLATGNPPCNVVEGVGGVIEAQDGCDDLGPERDDGSLADALPAQRCRCERPLPAPDDGELRCTQCGHACDGWGGAA